MLCLSGRHGSLHTPVTLSSPLQLGIHWSHSLIRMPVHLFLCTMSSSVFQCLFSSAHCNDLVSLLSLARLILNFPLEFHKAVSPCGWLSAVIYHRNLVHLLVPTGLQTVRALARQERFHARRGRSKCRAGTVAWKLQLPLLLEGSLQTKILEK